MPETVYTREWLADGRIVCYRFVSTGSEAAEAWLQDVTDLFFTWDKQKPLLLLVDLRRADNLMSAEMLKSIREAVQERPAVPGKTAVLVASQQPIQTVEILIERVPADKGDRKMFDQEAEAVAWLLQ